jgi:glycosyltransferase involved in cell wall biosynthesis
MSQPIEQKIYRIVHLTSAHPVMDVRIFHKECRSLGRAGFEVIQICNHDLNATVDGVQILGLGKTRGRANRFTKGLVKIFVAALRCRGDLYHLHDPDLLILGLVLRALGKRVVYDIHEDLPTKILLKMYLPKITRKPLSSIIGRLENALASFMSGIITATPTLRDRFERSNPNIVVVNNFPMLEEFDSVKVCRWEERMPHVAYFGGISEARGIEEMIEAIAMLPSLLGVRLELAGWFYVESLLGRLKDNPHWKLVNWHSEVDRSDLGHLLNRVSIGLVVLHPEKSFISSQPTKLFEYMAAGIPVIASDFPLWRTIIESCDCGLLVDPLAVGSIAAAIESLITNPATARAMGERGRRAIKEHFNWANEEQTLLSFYSCLLKGYAARAGYKVSDYSSA